MQRTTGPSVLGRARVMTIAVSVLGCLFVGVLPLRADVVVEIYQSGPNVFSSYSGTIDLTGLTPDGVDGTTYAYIWPANGVEVFGPTIAGAAVYSGITGPADFGAGSVTYASSSTGDTFGIAGLGEALLLPVGYVSGSFISGTDIWNNTTLAGLGLSTGTFTYTWGDPDSISVVVATPEPSTFCMLALTLLGALFVRRKAWTLFRSAWPILHQMFEHIQQVI